MVLLGCQDLKTEAAEKWFGEKALLKNIHCVLKMTDWKNKHQINKQYKISKTFYSTVTWINLQVLVAVG